MRILLALALFAAACGGSKKTAKSAATTPEATESKDSESELRDANQPDDADDERSKSADDPCDGGE